VGTNTFLTTYTLSSLSVLSNPVGLVGSVIAATQGKNLPHDLNSYEQSAIAKAKEVRDYLVSVGYGGRGMACLD